jgi:hypothetical protein
LENENTVIAGAGLDGGRPRADGKGGGPAPAGLLGVGPRVGGEGRTWAQGARSGGGQRLELGEADDYGVGGREEREICLWYQVGECKP